jgi:hypothetical protein
MSASFLPLVSRSRLERASRNSCTSRFLRAPQRSGSPVQRNAGLRTCTRIFLMSSELGSFPPSVPISALRFGSPLTLQDSRTALWDPQCHPTAFTHSKPTFKDPLLYHIHSASQMLASH